MVRYFTFLDLTFRVASPVAGHVVWLTEFLHPFFGVAEEPRRFDVAIELMEDVALFDALMQQGSVDSEAHKEVFALDNSIITLPVWNDETEWLTMYESKFRTFFQVRPDHREVRLITGERPRFRIPLMRVLREYVMNHYMQQGGVFLHASGVAFGDNGLLMVGTKNAGKTSLLTHFLRSTEARYVSNDRIYIALDADPPFMRGIPTLATIRSAMLPLFPDVREQLEASTFYHHCTLDESTERGIPLKAWGDGRYGFTPAQFLSIHGATPQAQALPRAMLFPRVMHEAGTMRAVPLSPDEVATRFPEALFGANTWRNKAEVFNLTGALLPPVEALLQRCQKVALSMPCYEIQLGTEAYTAPQATEQMLQAVLG